MWAKANPGVPAPAVTNAAKGVVVPAPVAAVAAAPASAADAVTTVASEDAVTAEWENLELQRDLAFKIVYFFIFFIVATFGLLYAYFKIDEKEKIKEEREARAKGTFGGKAN